MSAIVRWERELQLPGIKGTVQVLVCEECGAILKRRMCGYPAREIGSHAPDCPGVACVADQTELFA